MTPDPDCPECGGTGMVESDPNPPHPPRFSRCVCVLRKEVLANVNRAYPGLVDAPVVRESPLAGKHTNNLWVTGGNAFLAHLRHVAVRQPATWFLRVTSDAELVTSWLSSIALKGGEILDGDAYMVSTQFITIPDLVVPPDLLVIRMGVKVARNEASSEVLAEALNERLHLNRPTWVWDTPDHPLNSGHLFWSKEVQRSLRSFEEIKLDSTIVPRTRGSAKKTTVTTRRQQDALGGSRKSLRGSSK